MKNKLIIIALALTCFNFLSCKSYLFNKALTHIGAYDEKISLKTLENNSKKVVFFQMVHIGNQQFYDDVTFKIDSLKSQNFYFYYEEVIGLAKQDTVLRKIRKIRDLPFSENGYVGSIDSLINTKFNFEPKKELLNQPSYSSLGLDSLNSRRVDTSLEEIVNYYEKKYGNVELEPCDFETTVFEESTCKTKLKDKKRYDDAVVDFRNNIVATELIKESKSKIAIIYGKGHTKGIIQNLKKNDSTWVDRTEK